MQKDTSFGFQITKFNSAVLCVWSFISVNNEEVWGIYEAYSESKYRFAVKEIRVSFHIKFYCYQILYSSNYFSTYSPPLLRHLL